VPFLIFEGRLLKILMLAQCALFWKHETLAVDLWRWSLFLVLTLCIAEFVWKCSWLFTTKFINVNMYSHGRGKISNLMNRFQHEFLDLTPAIWEIHFEVLFNNIISAENTHMLRNGFTPDRWSVDLYVKSDDLFFCNVSAQSCRANVRPSEAFPQLN
jgi:hypothetical protein